VGTHDGTFHCDEVLACYMLTKLTSQFKDAEIIRSRDPKVLETCDILVDVGGVYDPHRHRYDHHQIGFSHTLDDNRYKIKLSSSGLIYKHFGREIIQNLLNIQDEKTTDVLFYKVYESFMAGIDAIDNGVSRYDTDLPSRYSISTDLSSRVGKLNPWWNDPNQDTRPGFDKAKEMTGAEFTETVRFYGLSWFPAREIVANAIKKRMEYHPSGEILVLESFCPWKDHLFQVEEELKIKPEIKYCLFKDGGGDSRIQCVPVRSDSFANRKSLPKDWRGKRDKELSDAAGIDGCTFVHISGFIGGNHTFEGVLKMATKALESTE